MTDVTGFGLLGHLTEMAEGSGLSARIHFDAVPHIIDSLADYVAAKCIPGGTTRNWDSYGHKIGAVTDFQKAILADPQTSGGLLIAVEEKAVPEVQELLRQNGLERFVEPIGQLGKAGEFCIEVLA